MSAEKDLKEANTILAEIVSLWDSRCVTYDFADAIHKAKNWISQVETPHHDSVLVGIKSKSSTLLEFLRVATSRLGVVAVINCGDHGTINTISSSLLDFCGVHSLHGSSVSLSNDDTMVSIEGKGCYLLSVNYKSVSGAEEFSGGYLS